MTNRTKRVIGGALAALAAVLLLSACGDDGPVLRVSGDPDAGRRLVFLHGCGSCHSIPGVSRANGTVGPPLKGFARRNYISGALPNTPEDLARWIMDPQGIRPGTAMPDSGVTAEEARHIAAYLHTLQ